MANIHALIHRHLGDACLLGFILLFWFCLWVIAKESDRHKIDRFRERKK